MTVRLPLRLGAAALAALALSGCDTIGNPLDAIANKKPSPDEFAVISHGELQLPPGLGTSTLPEPRPGVASPIEPNPKAAAAAALTGNPVPPTVPRRTTISRGEAALLEAADANVASPTIRDDIQAENRRLKEETPWEAPTVFELFTEDDGIDPGDLLDADAEARRLQGAGVSAPVDQRALQREALTAAEEGRVADAAAAEAASPPVREPRFRNRLPRDSSVGDTPEGVTVYSTDVPEFSE